MMYGWDGVAPWYGMIFGPVVMIGFVVVTVLIVAWALRALGLGWGGPAAGASALDLLKERFARGEIDRKEYDERRQVLSGR